MKVFRKELNKISFFLILSLLICGCKGSAQDEKDSYCEITLPKFLIKSNNPLIKKVKFFSFLNNTKNNEYYDIEKDGSRKNKTTINDGLSAAIFSLHTLINIKDENQYRNVFLDYENNDLVSLRSSIDLSEVSFRMYGAIYFEYENEKYIYLEGNFLTPLRKANTETSKVLLRGSNFQEMKILSFVDDEYSLHLKKERVERILRTLSKVSLKKMKILSYGEQKVLRSYFNEEEVKIATEIQEAIFSYTKNGKLKTLSVSKFMYMFENWLLNDDKEKIKLLKL